MGIGIHKHQLGLRRVMGIAGSPANSRRIASFSRFPWPTVLVPVMALPTEARAAGRVVNGTQKNLYLIKNVLKSRPFTIGVRGQSL